MVNKVMILMHIVAYLFIIVVNALQFLFAYGSLKANDISTMCSMVVWSVCTLIFGVIANTIVSKILNATASDTESVAFSLMTAAAKSELSNQSDDRLSRTSINDSG